MITNSRSLQIWGEFWHATIFWAIVTCLVFCLESSSNAAELHEAAKDGQLQKIERLVRMGADVNAEDNKRLSPLHYAAYQGHADIVRWLLSNGARVDVTGYSNVTPLFMAAQNGHGSVVRLLLERGAKVQGATEEGATPLHQASQNGHSDVVSQLIAKGADVNLADKSGYSPLLRASQRGQSETIALLLKNGADSNATDMQGNSALHQAAIGGHDATIKVLFGGLRRGLLDWLFGNTTRVNAENKAGMTPLASACERGYLNIVRFLLDKGADINRADKLGITPLMYTVRGRIGEIPHPLTPGVVLGIKSKPDVELIELLLKQGAKVNVNAKNGDTALKIAISEKHERIVSILKAQGAR